MVSVRRESNTYRDITNSVRDYHDDFRLYLAKPNFMEVSYHSVEEVKVVFNESNHDIVHINNDHIGLVIESAVSLKVDIDYVD